MGNIRLYGSTSGYTELAPPAVAPDGVLSLPSGVGTLLTAEGGKVLQVVRATDVTARSTTSTSYVDITGASVTITPTKDTSVILLILTGYGYTSASNIFMALRITDSANNAISGAEQYQFGGSASGALDSGFTLIGYATPATTSPVTYKGRFKVTSGTGTLQNNQQTLQMYAIEVSA